jgi:hypothetical protein
MEAEMNQAHRSRRQPKGWQVKSVSKPTFTVLSHLAVPLGLFAGSATAQDYWAGIQSIVTGAPLGFGS